MNLNDVILLESVQILSENKNSGTMKIRGVFQRADEANANNRIYPKAILENSIKSLTEKLESRSLLGELDHPTYTEVKLQNASHLITSLTLEGNDMIGEAEILPTQAGRVAQDLIRSGVKVGISSRGTGTLSESGNGVKTVNEDFNMVTFDLVADPSTRGAFPALSESVITEGKEAVKKAFQKVYGEKIFVNLLSNKINEAKGKLSNIPLNEDFDKNDKQLAKKGDWIAYYSYESAIAVSEVKYIKKYKGDYQGAKIRYTYVLANGKHVSNHDVLEVRKDSCFEIKENKMTNKVKDIVEGSLGIKRTSRVVNSLRKKGKLLGTNAKKRQGHSIQKHVVRSMPKDDDDGWNEKQRKAEMSEGSLGMKRTARVHTGAIKKKGFKSPDAEKALDRFAHSDEKRNKRLDIRKKKKLAAPVSSMSEGFKKVKAVLTKETVKEGKKSILDLLKERKSSK